MRSGRSRIVLLPPALHMERRSAAWLKLKRRKKGAREREHTEGLGSVKKRESVSEVDWLDHRRVNLTLFAGVNMFDEVCMRVDNVDDTVRTLVDRCSLGTKWWWCADENEVVEVTAEIGAIAIVSSPHALLLSASIVAGETSEKGTVSMEVREVIGWTSELQERLGRIEHTDWCATEHELERGDAGGRVFAGVVS